MRRCLRCVIPDTRPDTAFVDGVCSACLSFERRPKIDWEARLEELKALLDRHHGEVLVPSSGGKDSTYQAITLLEMGAKVTVVTAATCYLTDIGRANIDNLARYAPTIEVTPNRTVRAKLNRLGLDLVGDISWPEHAAIFSIPFRMAATLGVPLIMYGENPQDQYGGPLGTQDAREMTLRWRSEFGGFLGLRPSDFVGLDGITEDDMSIYEPPRAETLADAGVEAHFLGQYIQWDSERNARVAMERGMRCELPCEASWWTAENQDCAMTGLHDHAMYRKYGYGRLAAQVSVDVRSGKMTRDDALKLTLERDGIFPTFYMGVSVDQVLNRIGMTYAQLMETLDRFTNWDLFDGMGFGRPKLRA
jgi:N-acetyl sugar amidotransferase